MLDDILKVPEEEMKEKACAAAKNNFRSGLNCSESVYAALVEVGLIDFSPETVAIATAFGGGIGLTGGVCGAFTGLVMGVSAVHGRRKPLEGTLEEGIDKLYGNPGMYRFFNQIPHRFEQEFGSTICSELSKDYSDWHCKDKARNCKKLVVESAGLAVEFIYQGFKEGFVQPFGQNMAGQV